MNITALKKIIKDCKYRRNEFPKQLAAYEELFSLKQTLESKDIEEFTDDLSIYHDYSPSEITDRVVALLDKVVEKYVDIMSLRSLNDASSVYLIMWEKDGENVAVLGKAIPLLEKWVELADKERTAILNPHDHDQDEEEQCMCCDYSEWLTETATYYLKYAILTDSHNYLKQAKGLYDRAITMKGDKTRTCHTNNAKLTSFLLQEKEKDTSLSIDQLLDRCDNFLNVVPIANAIGKT